MTNEQAVKIRFEDLSVAESSKKISRLRTALLDLTPDISAEIVKDTQETQDLGTTLVLVLGAPAVVAIAKGIANYLSREGGTIRIDCGDTHLRITGIQGKDLPKIIEAIKKILSNCQKR